MPFPVSSHRGGLRSETILLAYEGMANLAGPQSMDLGTIQLRK